MKIYVASSWGNKKQEAVVTLLREDGHEVHDFHAPYGVELPGVAFCEHVSGAWRNWGSKRFVEELGNKAVQPAYEAEFHALVGADVCLLLNESGRSAHLQAGFARGRGIRTIILVQDGDRPRLMYKLANEVMTTVDEVRAALKEE